MTILSNGYVSLDEHNRDKRELENKIKELESKNKRLENTIKNSRKSGREIVDKCLELQEYNHKVHK